MFSGKRVLVTGGTGSLGQVLTRRLLDEDVAQVIVFSRDEEKQYHMRRAFDDDRLSFQLGNVRDYPSVLQAVRRASVIFHVAALKQVPSCEYAPWEAVRTNIGGANNLVRAIRENHNEVELVVGISTDKACKPVNVMGMTKALQERVLVEANCGQKHTRFICVRYGNVIGSRGSVIPLFQEQIRCGGPVTLTWREMTRFFLTLDTAVETIFSAAQEAYPGEIYVPKIPSARILDLAHVLIDGRDIGIVETGIRPGEKVHEILVSEEEGYRTVSRGGFYAIQPALPELGHVGGMAVESWEYSSYPVTLDREALQELVRGKT